MSTGWSSEWLDFAYMDLSAAEHLLTMRPLPVEIICYHCEQAAEKFLKATLVQFDREPPKTHDLTAVYKITIAKEAMDAWDMLSGLEGLSENLKIAMRQKAFGAALITQINAQNGATTLAATTVCSAGKTFVSTEEDGDAIYLYVYENACPAAVSFVKGEDNTVSASGTFIINDGFDTSSPESLQEFFGETGAVVENVPIT